MSDTLFLMCNHYRIAGASVMEMAAGYHNDLTPDDPDNPSAIDEVVAAETWPWKDNAKLPVVFSYLGAAKLTFMRWGVHNFRAPKRPISNARDDKLLTAPTWRKAVETRRCLIPADGFYEFFGPAGAMREALFQLPDEAPFFFAGLWTRDPIERTSTFAIVTGRPNATIAALPHDRMPVILEDGPPAHAWLGEQPLPAERIEAICQPYAGQLVRVDQPSRETRSGKISRDDLSLFSEEN